MGKVYANATEALDGLLHDDMLIAAGGFGLSASAASVVCVVSAAFIGCLSGPAGCVQWGNWSERFCLRCNDRKLSDSSIICLDGNGHDEQ